MLIPKDIFKNEKLYELNHKLKNNQYSLHWTKYNGDYNQNYIIKELINEIMKYRDLIKLNIIIFDKISNKNKDDIKNMIYAKFPERVLYGLLRIFNNYNEVNVDIFIEEETTYKKDKLAENIKKQLNIQSTYRGKTFKIENVSYKPKNEFIGMELIDLLIGIVKNILENKQNEESKKIKAKNELIVELLKNVNFYSFLRELKIFKWNKSDRLEQIEFSKVISLFLNNQEKWLEYLKKNDDEIKAKIKKDIRKYKRAYRRTNTY